MGENRCCCSFSSITLSTRDRLKTMVRCPELPGEITLGLCLCCLPDQRQGRHVERLMQTWGETQFFVFKTLSGPSPARETSPHSHQPLGTSALGAWICLATFSGYFQHENFLFPGPDPPNSLAISLHSGDTSFPLKCLWKTLLILCASPSLPSPLLPCAIIALAAVGSAGARLSWEAGCRLPLPHGIMGSSPDPGSWRSGEKSACISAPARSSASPPSLLTRVPISVSRTGSW